MIELIFAISVAITGIMYVEGTQSLEAQFDEIAAEINSEVE